MNLDYDECLYHSEQHELMLYLSISLMKINNQQCLGKYGLSFIYFFKFSLDFACILAIPTQTHKSYGWYFSVSCQISATAWPWIFFCVFFLGLVSKEKKPQQQQLVPSLKCWQLNPKIYPKDFIDFWFNCARLLNHVKVTLSKPFTRGMKSVVNKIIGPMPLLCRCLPFCCVIASGQQQRLIGVDKCCFPRIMLGSKKNMKKWKKKKKATTNRKKSF